MAVTEARIVVLAALLFAASAQAQTLPRVDGPLTLDRAVELALDKNLRVKAAGADARAMESMRKEAQAPFWPQLSANGYYADQRMAPNVYTSAGNTMARNYQVFNSDQTRDGNLTAMYSLSSGGRDYYGYKAAARRAEGAREMLKSAEVETAMQARLDYIAALREAENVRVTSELLGDVDERLRVTRAGFDAGRVRECRPDAGDGTEPRRAGAGRPEDDARRGSRIVRRPRRSPRADTGDALGR